MVTVLRQEEWQLIDKTITEIIRPMVVGTKILNPFKVDESVMEVGWDEYNDMAEASLDMFMEEKNFDALGLKDRKTVAVPIANRGFRLPWRMLAAARRGGRDMETANIAAAAAKVADKIEATIFSGSTPHGIKGLTNTTGIVPVTGAGFDISGNAYDTFRKARNKMITNNISPPYVGVLNPDQYGELDILIQNTAGPQRQMIIGNFVDTIYYSSKITTGEGYVIAPSKQYMDRVSLNAVKRKTWIEHPGDSASDILGRVYAIEIPRVRQPKAIVKMSSI